MDLSRPYSVLLSGADGEILRVLAGSTKSFTGRELAGVADRPYTTTRIALRRLADHGLVLESSAGRASLWTLNREHLAAGAAIELVSLRSRLLARLREELGSWDPPAVHASMFGSAARGNGGTASDIDLLVVRSSAVGPDRDDWSAQVVSLSGAVYRWTGNQASIIEVSDGELEQLARKQARLIADVGADAITLTGPDLAKLVRW